MATPEEAFEQRLVQSALEGLGVGASASLPEDALTGTLASGGKRIRANLVRRFGAMVGAEAERVEHLALAVEFLHAATLVHDDVIDNADTRRGRPSLHREHGSEIALLVGDLYVARCGRHLTAAANPRAGAEVWGALDTIVRGEIDQRGKRFDFKQSAEDYLKTIRRKTASLVEAASAGAAILGGAPEVQVEAARGYAMHLGTAFQLVDDVLDYQGSAEEMGKPVGNDIREGTVTLPLILTLQLSPAPMPAILESARLRDDVGAVVQAVRRCGALDQCLELASTHTLEAVAALEPFPDSPDREALMELARSLQQRRS